MIQVRIADASPLTTPDYAVVDDREAAAMIGDLAAMGIDRIVASDDEDYQFLDIYYASILVGAVVTFINPTPRECPTSRFDGKHAYSMCTHPDTGFTHAACAICHKEA